MVSVVLADILVCSVANGTSDSPRVAGLDYMMDALKLPNQIFAIFDGSSRLCMVEHCHVGRHHISCCAIRAVFVQMRGLICLIANVGNQLSDQLEVGHGERFPSSATHTHSITFFAVNPGFENVCDDSPSLIHYLLRC